MNNIYMNQKKFITSTILINNEALEYKTNSDFININVDPFVGSNTFLVGGEHPDALFSVGSNVSEKISIDLLNKKIIIFNKKNASVIYAEISSNDIEAIKMNLSRDKKFNEVYQSDLELLTSSQDLIEINNDFTKAGVKINETISLKKDGDNWYTYISFIEKNCMLINPRFGFNVYEITEKTTANLNIGDEVVLGGVIESLHKLEGKTMTIDVRAYNEGSFKDKVNEYEPNQSEYKNYHSISTDFTFIKLIDQDIKAHSQNEYNNLKKEYVAGPNEEYVFNWIRLINKDIEAYSESDFNKIKSSILPNKNEEYIFNWIKLIDKNIEAHSKFEFQEIIRSLITKENEKYVLNWIRLIHKDIEAHTKAEYTEKTNSVKQKDNEKYIFNWIKVEDDSPNDKTKQKKSKK